MRRRSRKRRKQPGDGWETSGGGVEHQERGEVTLLWFFFLTQFVYMLSSSTVTISFLHSHRTCSRLFSRTDFLLTEWSGHVRYTNPSRTGFSSERFYVLPDLCEFVVEIMISPFCPPPRWTKRGEKGGSVHVRDIPPFCISLRYQKVSVALWSRLTCSTEENGAETFTAMFKKIIAVTLKMCYPI